MGESNREGAAGTWERPRQPGGSGQRLRRGQALRSTGTEKAEGRGGPKEIAQAARGPRIKDSWGGWGTAVPDAAARPRKLGQQQEPGLWFQAWKSEYPGSAASSKKSSLLPGWVRCPSPLPSVP